MPIFEFRATDAEGRPITGTVHGSTLDAAARDLGARGLQVEHVQLAGGMGDPIGGAATAAAPPPPVQDPITQQRSRMQTDVAGPLVGKVALSHLLFFFRQAASMFDAGVPPVQALNTLASQTGHPKLKMILTEVGQHVLAGRPMSFGLQRYPEVFSPLMISLLRAGEEGGFLVASLRQLADYTEREIELRNLIRRVTFYPKLVIGSAIVIIGGAQLIISMVAPNSPVGLTSPLTRLSTWVILGPLLIALFLFVRVGLANPAIKFQWDSFLLRLPVIGKTVHEFAMAKFGRAFGALYRGGVPIAKGLQMAADACGNEAIRARIYPAVRRLESGEGIAKTLASTGAMSPIVLDMLSTGETTGQLDQMLEKMAQYYEDEAGTRSVQLGWILGVLALLAVAAYVAYVVITFYTGYFSGVFNSALGE